MTDSRSPEPSWRVGVDVGGTFTDIALDRGDGSSLIVHKVPSTPEAPERAILSGLAELLQSRGLSAGEIVRFAHGTTVGTNAVIQGRCGRVALVTSEGFRDLLEIGRQTRPTVYDMHRDHPPPLVPRRLRFEVPQRRLASGASRVPLDEAAVAAVAKRLSEEAVDCVVVCFLHSYADAGDESRAVALLRVALPERVRVFGSASVYPEFREYERFSTAVLNGALCPVVGSYLDRLVPQLKEIGVPCEVKIGQSSGGLMSVSMARELPVRASLSGPAAGVRGALRRALAAGYPNVVTLDAGGTSADVALLRDGEAVTVAERSLAGFPVRIPALDVNAVGAGGGSIAKIGRDGLLKVGPESAGADPGPACYGQGGRDPTVTDANVLLGRLHDRELLGGRMKIDRTLAEEAVGRLAERLSLPLAATALGIVRVACAVMVKAIRSVSVERGHDPRQFALFVYGGSGALHASEVAREIGIRTVVVPSVPGILCAEGALHSRLTTEFVRTVLTPLDDPGPDRILSAVRDLRTQTEDWFAAEGVEDRDRIRRWSLGARYFGQNFELALPFDPDRPANEMRATVLEEFRRAHEASYGFASVSEPVQVVHVSVRAEAALECPAPPEIPAGRWAEANATRPAMFDGSGFCETPVYERGDLASGQEIAGPAIVEQMDSTALLFPGDACRVDRFGNLILSVSGG